MTTTTPDLGHPSRRDLFLSYRRLDAERVAPVVAALAARGVTVWQDASEIDTLASIQRAIDDGLANVRALLVWYSKDYNASRACQWELTTAYSAAQAAGEDPRRRVLVINAESDTQAHIVLPELFDQLHLNAAQLSADEMAERIQARLDDAAGGVHATTLGSVRALGRPTWYGSAGLGSTRFVGRLREMWRLHATLQAEQAAMLTGVGGAGRPGVLQVRGSGGMGKSLLAEEYALRFGAAYPGGVFWLRAFGYSDSDREMAPTQREAMRDDQIRNIAAGLLLEPHGLKMVEVNGRLRRHFQTLGQPFLWIVDDLPPIERTDALAPWLAPHELGRTLITTRARQLNHIEKVELPQLDAEEALRLLARCKVLSAAEEAAARAICAELGGHALAVDVTASLAHDIGFAEVLDMLRKPDEDALEFAAELDELLPVDHQRSVAATFLASIKRLEEPGRDLLRLASVLANAPIPKQLQSGALGLVDQASDSGVLKTAIRGRDQLIKASLAENANDGAITVHTLVARTIQFHDGRPDRVEALRAAAVGVLLTKMPQVVDIRTHEALKDWVAHARQVSVEAQDAQTADLLGWVGRHDQEQGAYVQARNAYQHAFDTMRRVLGQDHPDTLTALNNLGLILQAQGDLVGARRYAEEVLDTMRRILGDDHPDTLTALSNLGQILLAQGDLVGARHYVEPALDTVRRVLGEDHHLTLTALNNLGQILQAQGDLVGARRYAEQALDTMRRVLGDDHHLTLVSLNNLGPILQAQGDLVGARHYAGQALDTMRRVLGEDHPHTLTSLNNLAAISYAQGDLVGTRRYAGQALDTMWRALGDDHPDTLTSLSNLATILKAQGDLVGARRYAGQALDTKRRVLGQDHPDTLIALNDLGLILKAQGDLVGARRYAEQVLDTRRRVFGEGHPSTLTSLNNLGQILKAQGDLVGARRYAEQVLDTMRRVLGEDHPLTLTSLNNLSQILQDQGDLVGARRYAEQTLDTMRRVLGDDHPDTLTSLSNLATILKAQGDLVGARRYAEQVLDTRQRVLGERHPDTSGAAWNLFRTLETMGEHEPATRLLDDDLRWLLAKDPAQLDATQRQIAGMVREVIGEASPG